MPETESLKTSASTNQQPPVKTVYVNVDFSMIASAINASKGGDGSGLSTQFDGKGRNIAVIKGELETQAIIYSENENGTGVIENGITIDNGLDLEFVLQAKPTQENNGVKFKWKGIVQSVFALQLVSGTKSTYRAVLTPQETSGVEDSVFIHTNFTKQQTYQGNNYKEKFAISWDPKVRIVRG